MLCYPYLILSQHALPVVVLDDYPVGKSVMMFKYVSIQIASVLKMCACISPTC